MSKNIQKITRADGVTQGYHVGSDASPATRPEGSPHSSPVTEEEVADRVQRGRAHAWTVIATDPNTGQVIADEVEAPDEWAAFQAAIEQRSDSDSLDYVAAIPGAHDVYTPTESGTTAAGVDYPTGDDDDTPIWDDTTADYVTSPTPAPPTVNMTARQWQLYSTMPTSDAAANVMNAVATEALTQPTWQEANAYFNREVLKPHGQLNLVEHGALDSEPRWEWAKLVHERYGANAEDVY